MGKTQDGIRVEIYDQEYHIRGELDPDYIQRLARYLDGKMRSIAQHTQTVDSLRVAILAALNVADEYYQLREQYDTTAKEVAQKVGACSEMLDQLLKRSA